MGANPSMDCSVCSMETGRAGRRTIRSCSNCSSSFGADDEISRNGPRVVSGTCRPTSVPGCSLRRRLELMRVLVRSICTLEHLLLCAALGTRAAGDFSAHAAGQRRQRQPAAPGRVKYPYFFGGCSVPAIAYKVVADAAYKTPFAKIGEHCEKNRARKSLLAIASISAGF